MKTPPGWAGLGTAIACGLLVSFLVFLFHSQFAKSNYLLSDSADYRRAATTHFLPLYLNTNSASPVQLFQLRHDPAFRSHPWDYLYFSDDNAAIRHFHTPVSYYAMHVISVMSSADTSQRVLTSVVTAVTCGVVVVGLFASGLPLPVAGLLALVAGIQSRNTEVSVDPSPHSWYMLFAVLFLFAFSGYFRSHRFRDLGVAAVFLGCAFATLEFSLELVVSVVLAVIVIRIVDRRALGDLRTLATSFGKAVLVFLLTTFVLWPGGWIRGGYLECYGVTGSTLVFKNKAAFGDHLSVTGLYAKFFGGHEGLLLLAGFALSASIVLLRRRKLSVGTIVFMSYTLVAFGLGVADHFRLDTYITEALLFLLITVALLFGDLLSGVAAERKRFAVAAAVVVLALVGTQEWVRREPLRLYQPWLQPILVGVQANVPRGSTVLVNDYWEPYYTYLPFYDYEPTESVSDTTPRSAERTRGVKYFLFHGAVPKASNVKLLESFPTNIPGRTVDLYIRTQ
ncbi:MAG TPA: hypothetical protein VE195_01940 [Acidobacteriaceae bacterium]|nr:hypothetical protein [Acidobacteriaceae bacterium]